MLGSVLLSTLAIVHSFGAESQGMGTNSMSGRASDSARSSWALSPVDRIQTSVVACTVYLENRLRWKNSIGVFAAAS